MRQQLSEEQLRIRTRLLCILLTVLFLARQHIALRKLPFRVVAKLVHSFGSTTGSTTFTLGRQYVGKDAARELLMNLAHVLRTWMNEQMRKSPTIGIMIDESTDIRKVKVATAQFLIIACA